MSRVRNRDTEPELKLRRELWCSGLRGYRLHRSDLPGTPDIAWIGKKVAVFVDGAFWHGHPSAFRFGQSGRFWDKKIASNRKRDTAVTRQLKSMGWDVIRLWDFEIHNSINECVDRVRRILVRREATP